MRLESYRQNQLVLLLLFLSMVFLFVTDLLCAKENSLLELRKDYHFIRDVRLSATQDMEKQIHREISPLGFTANLLLATYQTLISSQSSGVCNFTPSCSRFARDAINRAGFIKGSLMAADRLLRCHPNAPGTYPIDFKMGLAFDPVDYYINEP